MREINKLPHKTKKKQITNAPRDKQTKFPKKMQHNEINIGLPHVQEWRALKILAKI